MVDRLIDVRGLPAAKFRQREQRSFATLERKLAQVECARTQLARQTQDDPQRMSFPFEAHQILIVAAQRDANRLGDVGDGNSGERGLFLVRHEDQFRHRGLANVVHFDDARFGSQTVPDETRGGQQVVVAVVCSASDFGHERRQHRRTGRQFDDLELRAPAFGEAGQFVAEPQRDRVALLSTMLLADQIDAQFRKLRSLPQVVVSHETIEVDRPRLSDVAGEVGDFGHARQGLLKFQSDGVGPLQRRSLVQIEQQ